MLSSKPGKKTVQRVLGIAGLIVALAVGVLGLAGCGHDPYRSAVKSIHKALHQADAKAEKQADELTAQPSPDTPEKMIAGLDAGGGIFETFVAAVDKAAVDLRALTPPDEEARSFDSEYQGVLDDYSHEIHSFIQTLDYMKAGISVQSGFMPADDQQGVWSEVDFISNGKIDVSKATDAAAFLDKVKTMFAKGSQQWGALTPPQEMVIDHQALADAVAELSASFSVMSGLADSAVRTRSQATLAEVMTHWRTAADQYDVLLKAQDSWFSDLSQVGDVSTEDLDSFMPKLDRLVATL